MEGIKGRGWREGVWRGGKVEEKEGGWRREGG